MDPDFYPASITHESVNKKAKPVYCARNRGVTWSVYEVDARVMRDDALLHNLEEWQAKAIAAILNA